MNNRFSSNRYNEANQKPFRIGGYLIASPMLDDSPFRRAVVFVLQDSEEGTFGIVINRPGDSRIKSEWLELTGESKGEELIFQGGPVGGPVFAIHRDQSLAEFEVPGGIYVSSQTENFEELLKIDDDELRIVFGVAAWEEGQLAKEIDSGMWFVHEASSDHVFDNPDDMWSEFIRRFGRDVIQEVTGLKTLPRDSMLN